MATKISSTEARTVLGELLARAGYGGERFILERRGKPLAALISVQDLQRLESLESRETDIKEILPNTADVRLPSKTAPGAENVFASLAGIWQHLSDDDIRHMDRALLEMRHQTAKRLASLMQGAGDD
jgi:prevent-host-death family protein